MICRKCGAQIPDNSEKCSFCGAEYEVAPVKEETPENEVIERQNETLGIDGSRDETDRILDENEKNRLRQAERINYEKQQQLDEIAQRRAAKKRRQHRNRALVVLAAVAVCGAVAAGVNHVKHRKEDVPEVVVVSHEPTQAAPEVVTSPDTEGENGEEPVGEGAENTEAAASADTAAAAGGTASAGTGGTSWRATGGAGSTGSTAAGLAPSTGSGAATGGSSSASRASGTSASSGSSASGSSASGGAGTAASSKTAYNGSSFKSALVTGGQVQSSGGKSYMSFDYNGKTYYAKVSPDTTTAYVSGKPMTISASKTSETYNGSEVYEITSITNYNGNYVFAESGYKLLTAADLTGKSAWELKVGRNEIYARHGRQFKDQALQAYFNSCSWYKPDPSYNPDNDSAYLNATELKNAYFILDYENAHQ